MFDSGVSLAQALSQLADEFESEEWRDACRGLLQRVQQGRRLDRALADFRHLFSQFHCQLVGVGMETGKLAVVLRALARYEQEAREMKGRIWAALAYPLFTLAFCLALIVIGPPYLFSSLFQMFRDQEIELPILTKFIMFFSDLCLNPIFQFLMLSLIVAVPLLTRRVYRSHSGRARLLVALSSLPYLGRLMKQLEAARCAKALSLALDAGLPILRGLKLAGSVSLDPRTRRAFERVGRDLTQGEGMTEAARSTDIFPPLYLSFLEAGEESGTLSGALNDIGKMAAQDFEHQVEVFQNSLEPLSVLFVGGVVGVFVVGALLPMSRLLESL